MDQCSGNPGARDFAPASPGTHQTRGVTARRGRSSDWWFVGAIVFMLLAMLFGSLALAVFFFWYVATHLQLAM